MPPCTDPPAPQPRAATPLSPLLNKAKHRLGTGNFLFSGELPCLKIQSCACFRFYTHCYNIRSWECSSLLHSFRGYRCFQLMWGFLPSLKNFTNCLFIVSISAFVSRRGSIWRASCTLGMGVPGRLSSPQRESSSPSPLPKPSSHPQTGSEHIDLLPAVPGQCQAAGATTMENHCPCPGPRPPRGFTCLLHSRAMSPEGWLSWNQPG